MDSKQVCTVMGFDLKIAALLDKSDWTGSVQSYPGKLPFANVEFIQKQLPKIKSKRSLLSPMTEMLAVLTKTPEAEYLAWHIYRQLFLKAVRGDVGFLPEPIKLFGDNAGLFYLLLALSAIPLIENTLCKLQLPQQYCHDAPKWIGGTVDIYAAAHQGRPGHDLRQLWWLRLAIDGRLFRIGRLEYTLDKLDNWLPILLRRRADGQIVALCGEQCYFDAQHRRLWQRNEQCKCVTHFYDAGEFYEGCPIHGDGTLDPEQYCRLAKSDYEVILKQSDLILGLHIPGGEKMDLEAIRQSVQEAVAFCPRYLHREVKAFFTESWLLNPDLAQVLPPDANVVKFQKEVHLLPWFYDDNCANDSGFFVFGRDDVPLTALPATNHMQAALQELWQRGQKPHNGAMFILPENLAEFGKQYYRKATLPATFQIDVE